MTITKTAVVLVLTLLLAPPLLEGRAQDASRPPEAFQDRLEQLKDRLQLTPEQVEQVRPVLVEEFQQLQAIREKHAADQGNRRARIKMGREMRGVRDAADRKLRKLLSKSQMEQLEAIRQEARDQWRATGR